MKKIRKIIILGPQASGKGTQAEFLSKRLKLPKITTGDLIRMEISRRTPRGKFFSQLVTRGRLVPDKYVNEILFSRLKKADCRAGFILDGYPRNLAQARSLEKVFKTDLVVEIKLSDKEAISRISGRRICQCGTVYHLKFAPPAKKGACDKCGGKLFQREDDKPPAIRKRLKIYHRETEPLVRYYRKKGILIEINGRPPIPKVSQAILAKLKKF